MSKETVVWDVSIRTEDIGSFAEVEKLIRDALDRAGFVHSGVALAGGKMWESVVKDATRPEPDDDDDGWYAVQIRSARWLVEKMGGAA